MTSDRKLEASREGSKGRIYEGVLVAQPRYLEPALFLIPKLTNLYHEVRTTTRETSVNQIEAALDTRGGTSESERTADDLS